MALLEVARIFSRLYSDFRSQGSYNLLFVLTGLDRINYLSTKSWLRNIDARILESLEFALCLDRLAATSAPLYLHVSKLPKSPEIQSLYSNFEVVSKRLSIPFEIVHRKINISDPQVYWQHEQFSRKRIVSATLSSSRTPQANAWEGGLFDSIAAGGSLSVDTLARNVRFVVESLGRQVYGLAKSGVEREGSAAVELLAPGVDGVNSAALRAQLALLTGSSRFGAVITPADSKAEGNTVLSHLESQFARHTSDHKKHTVLVDQLLGAGPTGAGAGNPGWKFYADKPGGSATNGAQPRIGVVEMQAFQVKPLLFDIYVSLAIAVWLLVVYIACKQPGSVADVVEILIGK